MKLTKKQAALIGKNEIVETANSKGEYTGNYRLVGRDFDYVDLPGSGGKVTIDAALAFLAKREGRAEVRASASRANGAKGGRPSLFSEFLRGFAEAAGVEQPQADAQWAGYSSQLSDKSRDLIERGGYEMGLREGAGFKALYS